jgi:hypothetical protein
MDFLRRTDEVGSDLSLFPLDAPKKSSWAFLGAEDDDDGAR